MELEEKIEAYLKGDLSDLESETFKNEIESDIDLAALIDQIQKEKAFIALNIREELKRRAEQIYKGEENKVKPNPATTPQANKPTFRIIRFGAIAASILILITAGWWFSQSPQLSATEVFATYYESPRPSSLRNLSSIDNEVWNKLLTAFSSSDFENLLEITDEIITNEDFGKRSEAQLFKGIALLELGRYELASRNFQAVDPESSFKAEAQWYDALSSLRSNDLINARQKLELIIHNDGYKKKEAIEILELIND